MEVKRHLTLGIDGETRKVSNVIDGEVINKDR